MNNKTSELIRKKASELIATHGYDALEVVDRQVQSKQDLLFSLLEKFMTELIDALQTTVLPIQDSKSQLQAFVGLHIDFHAMWSPEALIATTALNSLSPFNYKKIVALRNLYDGHVRDIIQRGCDQRRFSVSDVSVAAASLITMLTHTTRRHSELPDVPMEAFTAYLLERVLRLVGAAEQPSCTVIPFRPRR